MNKHHSKSLYVVDRPLQRGSRYVVFGKKGVTWKRWRLVGAGMVASLTVFSLIALNYPSRNRPTYAIQSTYTVTSTSDSGAGSLRQAILDANLEPTTPSAPHLIQFNINGGGVHTIQLLSDLPTITNPTIIDGSTRPGSSCGTLIPSLPAASNTPHVLNIVLRSAGPGSTQPALNFTASADGSRLKGMVINSNQNPNVANVEWAAPNGIASVLI